ncbi:VOC family protein [Nocardia thailandica]|uniref:VOC family protein n=1 Tax=Nocardia thailandica TaxID=257275 RepID=A0ABW6PPG9_9NOCA
MARPRRFTDDQVLDAARDLLADPTVLRPAIAAISAASGIHTGSIYVRFASRDELLARLWLRSIRRFHVGLLDALRGPDPLAAAASYLPRYCRENPTEARAMKMFHRDELLEVGPPELRAGIASVNDEMNAALLAAVRADLGDDERAVEIARMAVKAIPYGLVREYIARAAPIPPWVDDVAVTAARAALDAHRGARAPRTGPAGPPDGLGLVSFGQTRVLVDDFGASYRFYRDTLGLVPKDPVADPEAGPYACFTVGGTDLALFSRAFMDAAIGAAHGPRPSADTVVVVLRVAEVDHAVAVAAARGARVVAGPVDRPAWGMRVAQLRAPEGTLVEFCQYADRA